MRPFALYQDYFSGGTVFMNISYRRGLDVGIAFASRLKNGGQLIAEQVQVLDIIDDSWQLKIKMLIRKVLRYGYRLLKTVVRPIAFKVRRYLIDGLHQEIKQECQRISTLLLENQQFQKDFLLSRLESIEQYNNATSPRGVLNGNDGEGLIRTEVDFVLCDVSDYALLSCLLETGKLESGTRHFIQNFLRFNNVYDDAGANIGMHTLAVADIMHRAKVKFLLSVYSRPRIVCLKSPFG